MLVFKILIMGLKLFVIFVCSSVICFSQEVNNENSNGDFSAHYFFGNVTIELENNYKVNGTTVGGGVGKEFNFNENYSLIVNVDFIRIQNEIPSSTNNNQLFQVNNFIKTPILLRYKPNFLEKTGLFAEAGIYASSLYNSKIEDILNDNEISDNMVGYNFGLQINIGIKYKINNSLSFNIGLNSYGDLFQLYDDVPDFKILDSYSFQFGVGLKL